MFIIGLGNIRADNGHTLKSESDTCAMNGPQVQSQHKLHSVLLSFGATVPFHRSMLWQCTIALDYRIYKNLYLGLTAECETQRFWNFKERTDSLCGMSFEITAMVFSNPVFQKSRFSIGFWGNAGLGWYRGTHYLSSVKDGALESYDSYEEYHNQAYLTMTAGVYFKYRRLYATVGYHVTNLELKPYGSTIHHGIFRAPSLNGLSLMLRFGI